MDIESIYTNQVQGKNAIVSLHTSSSHYSEIIKDPAFTQINNDVLNSILNILEVKKSSAPPPTIAHIGFEQALKELTQPNYD